MSEFNIKANIMDIINIVNKSVDNPTINDYFNALIKSDDVVSNILVYYKNNNKRSDITKIHNDTIESLVELVLNANGISILEDGKEDIIYDEKIGNMESIKQYYKDILGYKVFSHEEQLELFKQLESLKEELKEVTSEEQKGIIKQKIKDVKDIIFVHNLRLVVKIANRHKSQRISLLDLIQEGNIALYNTIDKFDYHRCFKFSTYAAYWIIQAISRYIANNFNTIRIPVYMGGKIFKVKQVEDEYFNKNATLPTDDILSEQTELSKSDIDNVRKATLSTLISTLDAPLQIDDDNDDATLSDFVPSNDNVENTVVNKIYYDQLLNIIDDTLHDEDPRCMFIILSRFGFLGEPKTLDEIGQKLNVTRERVRQLENKSMSLIRNRLIEIDNYYKDKINTLVIKSNKEAMTSKVVKKQLDNIRFIEENELLSKLDKNSLIVIKYRKQYPEYTLMELANVISSSEKIPFSQSRVIKAFNLIKKIRESYSNTKRLHR